MSVDDARAAIVERVAGRTLVACNDDVPIPGLADALAARGSRCSTPDDPDVGGAPRRRGRRASRARCSPSREPAAIALAAAPGSPRGTSLVPPEHVCVRARRRSSSPTLADAMQTIAAGDLPSALTWIGGPSRPATSR